MSLALPVLDEDGGGFEDWRWQLRHRIATKEEIAARLPLTDEEAAEALNMKPRTMQRMWRDARQWLFAQMESGRDRQSAG